MAEQSIEHDDPFDSIVFAEDKMFSEGFKQGMEEGKRRGRIEGYQTGYKKGEEIGEEIGFYLGFTETWLSITATDTHRESDKLHRLLKGFSETLRMFDILNVHREDYNVEIVKMRSRYKQITSILKVLTEFQDKSELNF